MAKTAGYCRETIPRSDGFPDSRAHLFDELRRLELVVCLLLSRRGQVTAADPFSSLKGLVLSREAVEGLLLNRKESEGEGVDRTDELRLTDRLERLTAEIEERREQSLSGGIHLSLPSLSRLFRLTLLEEWSLLICLAPEIDTRYEKFYAYLQDDVTRKRPSAGLVLEMVCGSEEERLTGLGAFSSSAPLFRFGLLQTAGDHGGAADSVISRPLKIDERIVHFLLENRQIDSRIDRFARLSPQPDSRAHITLPAETREPLRQFLVRHLSADGDRRPVILSFHGPSGTGKHAFAQTICADLGMPMIVADLAKMTAGPAAFDELIWLLGREAVLQQAALCLENPDSIIETDRSGRQTKALMEALETFCPITLLVGRKAWRPAGPGPNSIFASFAFPLPDEQERRSLWESLRNGYELERSVDLGDLSAKFRFSPGQIRAALSAAGTKARIRSGGGHVPISSDDLLPACREQSQLHFSGLARKINPRSALTDIILPPLQQSQLREICNFVKYRPIVYRTWGFGRKLSLGKGLNVLFAGPPGTGKTMAAEIIAGELGLELYRIDLSQVVSKYIGETEKNLAEIFDEAQAGNAILFFDEADALFGKRSEVKDAHDRYANIETAYLLQKMEEYDGIAILATNLRNNMDEAFARRMHIAVDFPFPDEGHRRRIWESHFPGEMPRSGDIDMDFLARQFRLSGGNIRNAAVGAAFLAAAEGAPTGMKHIIVSIQRELRKMGKLCVRNDFGTYFDLLGEDSER